MGKGVFVTGTGTDVGKTIVTAGLLRMLRGSGVDAISMKPVQTGCSRTDAGWQVPDLETHWSAAGYAPEESEREYLSPYCYEPACSPHLAADATGLYPEIPRIKECYDFLAARHEGVLAEGAGGILVPLDEQHTMLDLMVVLGLPVLLVAEAGLGTINHTLLTLQVLRDAGLDVLGVVLNATMPVEDEAIHDDNPAAIAKFGKVEILGRIPNLSTASDALDWEEFESGISGFAVIRKSLGV